MWWDALRSVRTLGEAEFLDDHELTLLVEVKLGLEPGTAKEEDLKRYYDLRRNGGRVLRTVEGELGLEPGSASAKDFVRYYEISKGLESVAKVPWHYGGLYARELAKFPQYEDADVDEKFESWTAEELRILLDSLGGPSAVVPHDGGGGEWWNAMRALRTLPEARFVYNHTLAERVGKMLGKKNLTAADLWLYYDERRRNAFHDTARVPNVLSWGEVVTELAKLRRFEEMSVGEIEEASGARNLEELTDFLNSLGGPSSSGPHDLTTSEILEELRRRGGGSNREILGNEVHGFRSSESLKASVFPPLPPPEFAEPTWDKHEKGPPPPWANSYPDDDVVVKEHSPSHETRAINRKLWRDYALQALEETYPGMTWDEMEDVVSGYADREATASDLLDHALDTDVGDEVVIDSALTYLRSPQDHGPRYFGGSPQGHSEGWAGAMRRLRTVPEYADLHDDAITDEVERRYGLRPGTSTAQDLDSFWRETDEPGSGIAHVPVVLSRSEVLEELSKFSRYEGLTRLQIEDETPKEGRTPTTKELKAHLFDLGGPSSSSPEALMSKEEALEVLRGSARFGGMTGNEVVEALGQRYSGRFLKRTAKYHDALRGSRTPPEPVLPVPLEDLKRVEGFEGLSDQEAIEKAEEMVETKFASPEDIGRLAGVEVPRREPRAPTRDSRWWEALRRVRALDRSHGTNEDLVSEVEREFHMRPGTATAKELSYFYDLRKHQGLPGAGKSVPHYDKIARSDLLAELGRFPRYSGMTSSDLEDEIPRGGVAATKEEARNLLDDLGGPYSSSFVGEPEWWDSMRKMRTLRKFQRLEDHEIELRAKRGPGPVQAMDLEVLYEENRHLSSTPHAMVPRKLSREEILRELAKMPKYRGREGALSAMGERDLENLLNLLGGPSSSRP